MGLFAVDGEVGNLRSSKRRAQVAGMLVDTGAESSWIPEEVLRGLGIRPVKKDLLFEMADGRTITRSIGYALIRVGDFETVDEVVFGQLGDLVLLGARTLEGFGARVDPRGKRLGNCNPHSKGQTAQLRPTTLSGFQLGNGS